ncbi:hypothetical protein NL676_019970 [Syzygium grande]|nr:hypothetical protein NL676_019970 [Syzygium grande]
MASPLAHGKLASMATSLGVKSLMALSLSPTLVIMSSDPDIAKNILHHSAFSDCPVKESAHSLMLEWAIGFAPSGTYWHCLRRVAVSHMFSLRRVGGLAHLRGLEREMLLRHMVGEGYELIAKFNWEDHIPPRFLDFHGVKRCHELAIKVKSVVGQIVEERRRGGVVHGGNDFLIALLSCLKRTG